MCIELEDATGKEEEKTQQTAKKGIIYVLNVEALSGRKSGSLIRKDCVLGKA